MKITVDAQTKRFYLALDKWTPVVGHEIQIGKYSFCVVALSNGINVTEVTSGARVLEIPMSHSIMMFTESKEGTIEFYKKVVGERLQRLVSKNSATIDKIIEQTRNEAITKLGEMPPIEIVDTAWIEADISEILN